MSGYWAKLQCAVLDDPAVATLPDSAWRRLHECLLLAKTAEFEGDAPGFLPPVAISAWRLHIPADVLAADLTRLATAGFCELRVHPPTGDERWYLTNYEATQRPASAAERMRALRQRRAATAVVTNRNEFVTMSVPEQEVDQSKKQIRVRAAAARPPAVPAAAPAAAAAASDMQLLLKRHGFGWNRQTRQLEGCAWVTDEYIAAHVAAAEARGEGRGLVIQRMLGHEQPPVVKGAPAAATTTAWEAWQGWLARHGENGAAAVTELDATTRRMIEEFGRDDLATWGVNMFTQQYDLAQEKRRRRTPSDYEDVIQR